MSGAVVDLSAARAERSAATAAAQRNCNQVLDHVADLAKAHALQAFIVSGPIWPVNEQFAIDINRGQWRRLRVTVRRLARNAHPDVRRDLLDWADRIFTNQLAILSAERDEQRGRA